MYSYACMKKSICLRWNSKFQNGGENCELESGPGVPITELCKETINTVGSLITTNPHLSIGQLAKMLGISLGSVNMILRDHLHILCVCVCVRVCACTWDTMSVYAQAKTNAL